MSSRRYLVVLVALVTPLLAANSSGPIRLLSCVVNDSGLLEAEVLSASDSAQACRVRCEYIVRGTRVSHWFEVSIPARFSGIVAQIDTARGLPGNYSGEVAACRSIP